MDRGSQGKIPHKLLEHLLSEVTKPGREILIGPAVGEDAFAVSLGRQVLVGSSDPITFTSQDIGYYAVNVNANDVATMGARPRWFMATLLVPPGSRRATLGKIFREIDRTCVGLDIRLCGGHTEATPTVNRPVVVGAMLGTVSRRQLVRPRRARAGDVILITKRLALEGTSIIARMKRRDTQRLLGPRRAAKARAFLHMPGISVVKEALSAVEAARIHAMHDPTAGGLIWGLQELSYSTHIGLEVDVDRVPVYEETRLICNHLGLDPLGLIASGSLLLVVSKRSAKAVEAAIRAIGVECTPIGTLKGKRRVLIRKGKRIPWPRLRADEISKVV
jgi:hydrogenase expression/formation protein HypE